MRSVPPRLFFFFNDTATTEIYTLSLHDALPIYGLAALTLAQDAANAALCAEGVGAMEDRKSTRLNSSHVRISYAVFCLKKKNEPRLRNRRKAARTIRCRACCVCCGR